MAEHDCVIVDRVTLLASFVSARDCDANSTRLLTVLRTFSSLSVVSDSARIINDISMSSWYRLPLGLHSFIMSICCWRRNPIGDIDVDDRLRRLFINRSLRPLAVDKKGELGNDFCNCIRLAKRVGTSHLFFFSISSSIRVSIDDKEVVVDTNWYSLDSDQRLELLSCERFLIFFPCFMWTPHLLYSTTRTETAQRSINNRLDKVMTGVRANSGNFVRRSTPITCSLGTVYIPISIRFHIDVNYYLYKLTRSNAGDESGYAVVKWFGWFPGDD